MHEHEVLEFKTVGLSGVMLVLARRLGFTRTQNDGMGWKRSALYSRRQGENINKIVMTASKHATTSDHLYRCVFDLSFRCKARRLIVCSSFGACFWYNACCSVHMHMCV
jgi:hypothetical protein